MAVTYIVCLDDKKIATSQTGHDQNSARGDTHTSSISVYAEYWHFNSRIIDMTSTNLRKLQPV